MFWKWDARLECWICSPTTAAGAWWPLCSMNTACVAVTRGLMLDVASNGTEKTKLSGSMPCWSTALLYHTSSIARWFVSLKCLQESNLRVRHDHDLATMAHSLITTSLHRQHICNAVYWWYPTYPGVPSLLYSAHCLLWQYTREIQ